jgi:hypothetical protein
MTGTRRHKSGRAPRDGAAHVRHGVEILDRRMQLGGQFWIGARQMTLQPNLGRLVHMLTRR